MSIQKPLTGDLITTDLARIHAENQRHAAGRAARLDIILGNGRPNYAACTLRGRASTFLTHVVSGIKDKALGYMEGRLEIDNGSR